MEAVVERVSLEKELQLYKNLVGKFGFGFTYHDEELGMEIHKERGSNESIVSTTHIKSEENFALDLNLEQDIPFELVEEFLSPMLDLVPHHITFINNKGLVTLCNQRVLDDLELKKEDVIGKPISNLLHLPDEDILLLQSLKNNEDIHNKEVLDVNYGIMNTRIVRNSDGSIKRIAGLFEFLNQIKEAEKKAVAGRIAAGIAHEVRNPLTTVKGFLQILDDRVDNEVATIFSELLVPEIDRANSIITDFLTVARPIEISNPNQLLNVEEFMNYMDRLYYGESVLNNIQIEQDIDPELLKMSILGNKDELTQVFLNLFKNAIEATNDKLIISVGAHRIGSKIKVTFADNGKGIPKVLQQSIFDPFFTTKETGTGLGLSVSKKIIENHGGTMDFVSDSKGTTFIIELPLVRE